MSIPKVIHFCWLSGDPYPEKIRHCIDSWKRILPDYEIRLWDSNRFDLNASIWCKEAFDARKYAFAADYIRWYALFNEGGIYLDSDVEVLKRFDDLLHLPYFIGTEQSGYLEPAIVGAGKGNPIIKQILDYYTNRHFVKNDGGFDMTPLPQIMQEVFEGKYVFEKVMGINDFEDDPMKLCFFPASFFSPKRSDTFEINIEDQTYTIHHFNASWFPFSKRLFKMTSQLFGFKCASSLSSFYKKIRRMLK